MTLENTISDVLSSSVFISLTVVIILLFVSRFLARTFSSNHVGGLHSSNKARVSIPNKNFPLGNSKNSRVDHNSNGNGPNRKFSAVDNTGNFNSSVEFTAYPVEKHVGFSEPRSFDASFGERSLRDDWLTASVTSPAAAAADTSHVSRRRLSLHQSAGVARGAAAAARLVTPGPVSLVALASRDRISRSALSVSRRAGQLVSPFATTSASNNSVFRSPVTVLATSADDWPNQSADSVNGSHPVVDNSEATADEMDTQNDDVPTAAYSVPRSLSSAKRQTARDERGVDRKRPIAETADDDDVDTKHVRHHSGEATALLLAHDNTTSCSANGPSVSSHDGGVKRQFSRITSDGATDAPTPAADTHSRKRQRACLSSGQDIISSLSSSSVRRKRTADSTESCSTNSKRAATLSAQSPRLKQQQATPTDSSQTNRARHADVRSPRRQNGALTRPVTSVSSHLDKDGDEVMPSVETETPLNTSVQIQTDHFAAMETHSPSAATASRATTVRDVTSDALRRDRQLRLNRLLRAFNDVDNANGKTTPASPKSVSAAATVSTVSPVTHLSHASSHSQSAAAGAVGVVSQAASTTLGKSLPATTAAAAVSGAVTSGQVDTVTLAAVTPSTGGNGAVAGATGGPHHLSQPPNSSAADVSTAIGGVFGSSGATVSTISGNPVTATAQPSSTATNTSAILAQTLSPAVEKSVATVISDTSSADTSAKQAVAVPSNFGPAITAASLTTAKPVSSFNIQPPIGVPTSVTSALVPGFSSNVPATTATTSGFSSGPQIATCAAVSGFSFGAASGAPTTNAPSSAFASAPAAAAPATSIAPGFSLVSSSVAAPTTTGSGSASGAAGGAPATSIGSGFSFGSGTSAPSTAASGFSFGSASGPAPTTTTGYGFSFGSASVPAPTTTGSGFSFGSASGPAPTTTTGSGLSFGSASVPAPTTTAPGFSFGSASDASKTATVPASAISFGTVSGASTAVTTASKGFSFGSAVGAPAATSTSGSGFGTGSSAIGAPAATSTSGFSFGSSFGAAPATTAAPSSGLGSGSSFGAAPAATTSAASATGIFSSVSAPTATAASGFTFGSSFGGAPAPAAATTSAGSVFTFGSGTVPTVPAGAGGSTATAAGSMFSFGSGAKSQQSAAAPASFGSHTPSGPALFGSSQGSSNQFSFGATTATQPPPPAAAAAGAAFTFGGGASATGGAGSFGGASNPAFSFGSPATASSAATPFGISAVGNTNNNSNMFTTAPGDTTASPGFTIGASTGRQQRNIVRARRRR